MTIIRDNSLPWAAPQDRNSWPFYVPMRIEWDDTRGFHEVRDTQRFWTLDGALKRAAELNSGGA